MLSFQRWWKHAKVKLTMCGDDLFSLSPDLHLALWAHGVSADVQDPLVLSEGLTRWRGHILLHFSCRVVHDGIPRVHVVEEKVFGPRFPVVGSTLLSPKIRRRMRSCLCRRIQRKVIRTVRPGKTTTSVFLKNQRSVWSIFSSRVWIAR